MASDKISIIDLSEFVQCDGKIELEGIREHMQLLKNPTDIGEVKLLGSTAFYLPGDEKRDRSFSEFYPYSYTSKYSAQLCVDALKALIPEEGQMRTIERVELQLPTLYNVSDENSSKVAVPRLTIKNLCFLRYFHVKGQVSVRKDQLDTLLDVLKRLDINVQRTAFVCFHYPLFDPNIDAEGVKVECREHALQEHYHTHVPYVKSTSDDYSNLLLRPSITQQNLMLHQIQKKKSFGEGVAIAVLASGLDSSFSNGKKKDSVIQSVFEPGSSELKSDFIQNVVHRYNFSNQFSPVYESNGGVGSILTTILAQVAPDAKLIACRTSLDHARHFFPNGMTSRALNSLRDKWKAREWGEDVHSLIVLIPYGGHYREDEMRAINAAIDDGIIVICAAGSTIPQSSGDHIPGIAFPASMGNILCVGAVDDKNEPAFDSPSGREVDCVVPYHTSTEIHSHKRIVAGTGISAAVLSGIVALILSYIKSSLGDMPGGCPEYNHVSIIREVLQQTTTSTKHHPHSGYGLLTNRIFSFSHRQLKKLLNSITQERSFRTIPDSASEMTEQCKFNSDILSNHALNNELQLPILLDGGGIRVAVIDDDFPEILNANYKAKDLETKMHSWDKCTLSMSESTESLMETSKSLNKLATDLQKKVDFDFVAQEVHMLENEIEKRIQWINNEMSFKCTPIKESHGLQCAVVVANIAPEAELLLVNTLRDSQNLATMIENLVERPKRPDVIVCSLGFDQFNLRLSQAISKAINAGIIPVFSAGNIGLTSSNTISYPSRLGNVLCIGAHTWHGTSHGFSSVGREIDFLAPGEFMVLNKYPVSGTSFSAPAVAAFIALILQYVDKVVSGEWTLRPIDSRYKSIDAWSEEPPNSDKWGWHNVPLNKACRNVYVMRELLRQMSVHRTEHSDSAGYGNLDIRRLLKDLEPEDIHSIVQNFHKHSK